MAQWVNRFGKAFVIKSLGDPSEANQIIINTFPQQNSGEKQVLSSINLDTSEEGGEEELQFEGPIDKDAMSIIHIDDRGDLIKQVDRGRKEIGALNIEEAIPLNSTDLTDSMDPDNHSNVSFWVRQNVLKLAEEFGVHFNGSEELAEELFMKIDGKRQNPIEETKFQGDIREIIKDLWSNRWVKYVQLEANGTRGGIILMWNSRLWDGEICETGTYCITCKFVGKTRDFSWHMIGVYAPNSTLEREEVWWELGAVRGLFTGPWVVVGDFNTVRFPSEKKNCSRYNKAMMDFSEFIEDMELVDLQLAGNKYTWKKGEGHDVAARLDRFLISEAWENSFRNIKQSVLHRVTSDQSPNS
ncbi:hypothetical protein MTR67_039407 [Solanum verrucosum]|uniref:Endonuclease/exonuclease/phosphatase domain-containing protein n=1 Tax=Solanum verrucosum TaxID=315347 RepID=A0AAF0ZNK4_SOLVR|nr:hypothetical protein MTR67_039407 [Solanum verrucosum]